MPQRCRSSQRPCSFWVGAVVASLLLFAVTAKIVPYLPDPDHHFALSIAKISNECRKTTLASPPSVAVRLQPNLTTGCVGRPPRVEFARVLPAKVSSHRFVRTQRDFVRPPPA